MLRQSLAFLALAAASLAADFPQAEISSSSIHARLYLPDPQNGYYRATRFDWSGEIASLVHDGHSYFGQWFEKYDPKIHDAIMGPVEEFLTGGKGLGYDEVEAGQSFVKIGVGAVRKPRESGFHQFNTYEITDPGVWKVTPSASQVEFVQELRDTAGYAYIYRKTVRLVKDRPEMVLEHSLKNTGKKTIVTSVYEHNFYMLDGQPAGPDFSVKFPFAVSTGPNLRGPAEAKGNVFTYTSELNPGGQSVFTDLTGYGSSASDYDIRVENRKTGAGVRQTSDRPLARLVFWSIRSTVCPEAYIDMKIEPGQEFTWKINYDFYTLPTR